MNQQSWVAPVAEPTASGPLVRGWGCAVRFSDPAVSVAGVTHRCHLVALMCASVHGSQFGKRKRRKVAA